MPEIESESSYRAILICPRCGQKYYVPRMAESFTYWVCYPRHRCGALNIWKEK